MAVGLDLGPMHLDLRPVRLDMRPRGLDLRPLRLIPVRPLCLLRQSPQNPSSRTRSHAHEVR